MIVFGWRWPDYADAKNPHRENLRRLTSNLLNYLADKEAWRAVVIRSDYPPAASPDEPGVSRQRWRALEMAIEDLSASFPDRYRAGGDYRTRLDDAAGRTGSTSSSRRSAGVRLHRGTLRSTAAGSLTGQPAPGLRPAADDPAPSRPLGAAKELSRQHGHSTDRLRQHAGGLIARSARRRTDDDFPTGRGCIHRRHRSALRR